MEILSSLAFRIVSEVLLIGIIVLLSRQLGKEKTRRKSLEIDHVLQKELLSDLMSPLESGEDLAVRMRNRRMRHDDS